MLTIRERRQRIGTIKGLVTQLALYRTATVLNWNFIRERYASLS